MAFDPLTAVPAVATVLAALVAGGIARANLIASKESKISEFRQAWIDAVREDLAILFASTRVMLRAAHEAASAIGAQQGQFPKEKVADARHNAAETYHRVRLRLNAGQTDHKNLRDFLHKMMNDLQSFASNRDGISAADVTMSVEVAAMYAESVLKNEWEAVKKGEAAYREGVEATGRVLKYSLWGLGALVVLIPALAFLSSSSKEPLVVRIEPPAAAVAVKASVPVVPSPAASASAPAAASDPTPAVRAPAKK